MFSWGNNNKILGSAPSERIERLSQIPQVLSNLDRDSGVTVVSHKMPTPLQGVSLPLGTHADLWQLVLSLWLHPGGRLWFASHYWQHLSCHQGPCSLLQPTPHEWWGPWDGKQCILDQFHPVHGYNMLLPWAMESFRDFTHTHLFSLLISY